MTTPATLVFAASVPGRFVMVCTYDMEYGDLLWKKTPDGKIVTCERGSYQWEEARRWRDDEMPPGGDTAMIYENELYDFAVEILNRLEA